MEVITTNRLLLEPLGPKHCTEKYLGWLNDPTVYAYLETRGNQTLEMLKAFIEKQVNNKVYMWAVTLKEGNQHIGNIKIDPINSIHGFGEYGVLMGDKEQWGKGYAKEASLAVINYFFETKKLRKINLGVVKDNTAAVKLYENMGFEIEGVYKKQVVYDGIFHDIIRMALFNSALK